MAASDRKSVDAAETAFFANFWHEGSYDPTSWRLRLAREVRSLQRALGPRRLGRVLSIGCGDGQFDLLLARHADHVTALDLSAEAIALAERTKVERKVDNIDFRRASLAELSWDDEYDTIVCIGLLHHLLADKVPALLAQAHDHLTAGGAFYAEEPNVHGMFRKVGRVVLGAKYHTYHAADERELDPAEIAALLGDAGFEHVEIG